jgi:hypothetical protein
MFPPTALSPAGFKMAMAQRLYGPGNVTFDPAGNSWIREETHDQIVQTITQRHQAEIFNDPVMKRAYYQSLFNNPYAKGYGKGRDPNTNDWNLSIPGHSLTYRSDGSVWSSIVVPNAKPEMVLPPGSIDLRSAGGYR